MDSCWSCLVVIENGENVCPLCGADQTPLPGLTLLGIAEPQSFKSTILRWGLPAVAIMSLLGAALWYTTIRTDVENLAAQQETAAAAALVNIRAALSEFAISAGDKYPSKLEQLGDRAALPEQVARTQGYTMVYTPRPSAIDGPIRGFVLLAQPDNNNRRKFYIDQSGVVRATQESRPARIDDPPI
jgi:hypothetical protein